MKTILAIALVLGSMNSFASQRCTKLEVESALAAYSQQEGGTVLLVDGVTYKLPFYSFSTKHVMGQHPEMPEVWRIVTFKFKGPAKLKEKNAYRIGGNLKFINNPSLSFNDKLSQFIFPAPVRSIVIMDESCSSVIETDQN